MKREHYSTPSYVSWDAMFMGVALLAACRSKDPKSRNGACIVSIEHRILGVGYNGLPRGCDDRDPIFWSDDDGDPFRSKHSYVVHAELNAILNCVALPLNGARIYATQFPCPRCAQAIIQIGIQDVVFLSQKPHHERQNLAATKMFASGGVAVREVSSLDANTAIWLGKLSDVLEDLVPRTTER